MSAPRPRPPLAVLLACALAGCSGGADGDAATNEGWGRDAGEVDADGAPFDTRADTDGAAPDAHGDGPVSDAAEASADASATDATLDGATGCTVNGVAGACVDTATCGALAEHLSTPGYCTGPDEIQCCTPYGLALCDPSVVRHPNDGNTAEAAGQGGCPPGMLRVETFCIDRFEASLVRVSDGSSWSPYENPGTTAVRAVSVEGAVPQGYIDQAQAAAACANAGKRLCTDDEWLRACEGPGGFTYPYGDALQLGVCNDHRAEHPAIQYFGTDEAWIWSELDNACLDQLPLSLAKAGSFSGCVTAEGALDMMGNLHEWTADPAGTFRGGYFVDTVMNGPGCHYVTTAHATSHWDYSTGFRCCAG